MEGVKNWAFSVCCAGITGGILELLLPAGSIQKIYKTVFAVFFLCVFISPLSEIEFDNIFDSFKFDKTDYVLSEENEFDDVSEKYIKNQIADTVKAVLAEEKIILKDMALDINISQEGGIYISKFVLIFDGTNIPDDIADKIFEKTGLLPEIVLSEEK